MFLTNLDLATTDRGSGSARKCWNLLSWNLFLVTIVNLISLESFPSKSITRFTGMEKIPESLSKKIPGFHLEKIPESLR